MKTRLKELRTQRGLTLRELAAEFNTSNQVVSRYELGQTELDFNTLCKLADFFGVSVDYILCRDNTAPARIYSEDPTLKRILELYDKMTPVVRGQLRAIAEALVQNTKIKA